MLILFLGHRSVIALSRTATVRKTKTWDGIL